MRPAEAEKAKAAEKKKLEEEEKAKMRVKNDPSALEIWEEQDHSAITIATTRPVDVIIQHKGKSITIKYEDLPGWLQTLARTKHQDDGERRGLIREMDGRIYDLRNSPAGWVPLPAAEVIQILEDGYFLIDSTSLHNLYALKRVFKLRHNGLTRILNTGDKIQLTAMSVGTYTYENRRFEIATVPVYDAGMPVGPLRNNVVSLHGRTGPKPRHSPARS